MPTLRITYQAAKYFGRELELEDPVVRIGRDPANQVPFDENTERIVSRLHAEIRWGSTGPVLFPAPGKVVLLRDQPLSGPTPLQPGDLLVLAGPGGPSFEVHFEPPKLKRAPEPSEATTEESFPAWQPEEPTVGESTIAPAAALKLVESVQDDTARGAPLTEGETSSVSTFPARRIRIAVVASFTVIALVSIAMAWWSNP